MLKISEVVSLLNLHFNPKFEYEEKVLDHGYVKFIESYGSDESVIEDARMSTDKGFLGWDAGSCPSCAGSGCPQCGHSGQVKGDAKLLKYLYEHKHLTPFEGSGMKIEVAAPIMVFREWMRHRTQSYNEMSARYTVMPNVNYIPDVERCLWSITVNKQSAGNGRRATHDEVLCWLDDLASCYHFAENVYQRGVEIGIPREVARLPVSVGRYSKMRATANLRNWLAFLTLREDESAQWEIRQFAHVVARIIAIKFPRTYALYVEGRK